MWLRQMVLTTGDGCGHVKSIISTLPSPLPHPARIRSKAVRLLWFTIFVTVCLCMYVLVIFLFNLDRRLANFGASRKQSYIILTLLNPTVIKKNWGLQGYTLFFLFQLKSIDCRYSLEPPRGGGSNEYPQSCFEQKYEKYQILFIWKFSFFGGKIFSIFEQACFSNGKKLSFWLPTCSVLIVVSLL